MKTSNTKLIKPTLITALLVCAGNAFASSSQSFEINQSMQMEHAKMENVTTTLTFEEPQGAKTFAAQFGATTLSQSEHAHVEAETLRYLKPKARLSMNLKNDFSFFKPN